MVGMPLNKVTEPKNLEKRLGETGKPNRNWDCLYYNTAEVSQNTEKSPVELKRIVVDRTPM